MKQEEKELLLRDLCARLPYGVKVTDGLHIITLKVRIDTAPATLAQFIHSENLIYYLRPLSSMTDKEKDEYTETFDITSPEVDDYDVFQVRMVDWLLEHHFDVRGLIEKGLALEAPEGMYKI